MAGAETPQTPEVSKIPTPEMKAKAAELLTVTKEGKLDTSNFMRALMDTTGFTGARAEEAQEAYLQLVGNVDKISDAAQSPKLLRDFEAKMEADLARYAANMERNQFGMIKNQAEALTLVVSMNEFALKTLAAIPKEKSLDQLMYETDVAARVKMGQVIDEIREAAGKGIDYMGHVVGGLQGKAEAYAGIVKKWLVGEITQKEADTAISAQVRSGDADPLTAGIWAMTGGTRRQAENVGKEAAK